ncbi:cilia- and flagella-associated protein 161-like isoform X1 [Ostrea edulis]|uniref:cilia- and flagella-associated protein 161-like isoform X1 n=1 Tax=Ostrea edulis TaxID=37623 RepID=UPI0024AEEE2C|nr:cilia- and flagella-associated protein 161-like isoform X1 [Ostrea edulis]
MTNVRTYNPSVRVGNWNEDIQLEEDTLKDFLEKREKGQLLCQKRTKLEQTIFKQLDLSISRDGCVHFGDIVSLRCPATKDRTKYTANKDPRDACQLCVTPAINKILEAQKLEGPCQVSASKDLCSNLRSSFVIKSIDGSKQKGEPLRYGDLFYLCTLDNEGGDLYLSSCRATLEKAAAKSRKQEVTFVSEPSFMTEWRILHYNPQMRMEYEGIPVPVSNLCSSATNWELFRGLKVLIKTASSKVLLHVSHVLQCSRIMLECDMSFNIQIYNIFVTLLNISMTYVSCKSNEYHKLYGSYVR